MKLGAPSRHEEDDDDDCIDDRSALHISHNGQKLEVAEQRTKSVDTGSNPARSTSSNR